MSHLPEVGLRSWGLEGAGLRLHVATNSVTHRHSRAFLHALLHSDNTAALHHLTVHNIAYQVAWGQGQGQGRVGSGTGKGGALALRTE